MAGAVTTLSSDQMRNLANEIRSLAEEYASIYNGEIYGTAKEDIKKAWIGSDADAVISQLDAFKNDFDMLKSVMIEYAAHLEKAARTYDDAQETLRQMALQKLKADI